MGVGEGLIGIMPPSSSESMRSLPFSSLEQALTARTMQGTLSPSTPPVKLAQGSHGKTIDVDQSHKGRSGLKKDPNIDQMVMDAVGKI